MKLHQSVIDKIIQIYTNYGGFQDERRLRDHLNKMDFTPYERKADNKQEIILVLTEDYLKELNQKR